MSHNSFDPLSALALLDARRSVPAKQLTAPAPDDATLMRMLESAVRVPDHGKLAPWRFIVISGDERQRMSLALSRIARAEKPDLGEEMIKVEETRFTRAPVVVAVVSKAAPHVKIPEWEQLMSAGAVCLNMVISANALGYVSNWLTEWMAYNEKAYEIIGLAPGEKIAGFVHIGSTDFPVTDRPRPDLAEIVTWRS